jgi:hypothetical protein
LRPRNFGPLILAAATVAAIVLVVLHATRGREGAESPREVAGVLPVETHSAPQTVTLPAPPLPRTILSELAAVHGMADGAALQFDRMVTAAQQEWGLGEGEVPLSLKQLRERLPLSPALWSAETEHEG